MLPRSARHVLLVWLVPALGCAELGGSAQMDQRVAALEREIAALKQGSGSGPPADPAAAAPAPQVASAAPAAAPAESAAPAAAPAGNAAPGAAPATVAPAGIATTAAAQVPPAAADKPADAPVPLTWRVTPEITFKPGLRVQTRYVHDGGTNNNDIAIQRFRLKASGEAWKAKYGVEMKIDGTGRTNANPSAQVENAWLDYAVSPEYLIGRAGLYDVPFSRDALTSDSKLLFMDRSLIKDALTGFGLADNGIGVMVRGRPIGGHVEYNVGGFNNESFDGLGVFGRGRGSSGKIMPVARIGAELLDPEPIGGYADYKASYIGQGKRLAIGLNGAQLSDAEQRVSVNNVNVLQEFDIYAWGTDLFFNWGPYTLQAEYDWFRLTGDVDRSNWGWYVQGAYLIEPLKKALAETAPWFPDVELAGRYQQLDARSFSPEEEKRTSIGFNTYIHDHNLKVQTELSFRQLQHSADSKVATVQLQLDCSVATH